MIEIDTKDKYQGKKINKMPKYDRTLADKADAAPRKIGRGRTLEDDISICALIEQGRVFNLASELSDKIEKDLTKKRRKLERSNDPEISEAYMKRCLSKQQYESMLPFGYGCCSTGGHEGITIEEMKEHVFKLNKTNIEKSPLFRKRINAFFRRLKAGTLYNPDKDPPMRIKCNEYELIFVKEIRSICGYCDILRDIREVNDRVYDLLKRGCNPKLAEKALEYYLKTNFEIGKEGVKVLKALKKVA